jgi:tetratricopeptide (TPR) repeat protein
MGGCSLNTLMVNQMAPILSAALPSLEVEEDFEVARDAIPAQLKLLEGFLESSPNNRRLLELLARGWGNYAFGFIEDAIEEVKESDPARAEVLTARGQRLYLRGMNYGLRLLALTDDRFPAVMNQSPKKLEKALQDTNARDLIPALFWTGFGLAGAVNLGRDQPELIVRLPQVELIFKRIQELDESFFYAGSHLALGSFYASRIQLFGGDLEKGRDHFERAIHLTDGTFLMHKVLYAFYYAHHTQNRELFEKLLNEVVTTPATILPEQHLANVIAKRRAQRYLAWADDLF